MKKFILKKEKDLYTIKEKSQHYDEVTIHLNELKYNGLIRHAVKYSNYALKPGGRMIIHTSPFISYHFRPYAIDFWQVKYEVFNCLKESIDIIEVDPKDGRLVLQKKKHIYDYSGVSFGIVFSGNATEEQQLLASISSIIENNGINNVAYEILICGPVSYEPKAILTTFKDANIRYIPLDISTSPRLMICEKKNLLYANACYSIVVIIHTRILFAKNFITGILKSPVEMATPAVYYIADNKEHKYLDLGFLDNYQDVQFGAERVTVAGDYIRMDYLHWYKKRVPYIDGGLNVFNKNLVKQPPYNNYLAWGEAEDLDICNRLYQDGILIDYLPSIKCYSATCKVKGYDNGYKKIARDVLIWLNKRKGRKQFLR